MNPTRRRIVIGAAVGATAVFAGAGIQQWLRSGARDTPMDERAVAELWATRYTTLEGTKQTLADYRGNVLVINFWATWCSPCREEVPLFVKLQSEFEDKKLRFIGIAIDQPDYVRQFALEYKVNYPLLIGGLDAVGVSRRLGNKAGALPYTLAVSGEGQIISEHSGALTEGRLRAVLLPLLGP